MSSQFTNSRLSQIWQRTLDILENELSSTSFDTWMRYTQLVDQKGQTMYIAVPNEFAKEWLESRYYNLIKNTLQLLLNRDVKIQFILANAKLSNTSKEKADVVYKQPLEEQPTSFLNHRYTFDTFVIGNSNRFAHAAALAVSETPAKAYNPLFIYGGVGLGKTHLMHAIGHHVLSLYPRSRVLYVSSEKFTNDLINSIQNEHTTTFRNRYRNIDVLLVDDIQFLAGKERTQEEFFHTFNTLHEANKQIIISSDRPPKEIPTLEDRLRSRFEWGLITDIQPPDLETRIAILRKKAKIDNLSVPNDVMIYIANQIQTNIRELEGALIRVAAYTSLNNKKLTIDVAASMLKDLAGYGKTHAITVSRIQEIVANHFSLKVDDLKAKRRTRDVAFPRQIAMYLSRELTDSSLPRIGEEFGGRDHTTVIHAHEKISTDMKQDENLAKTLKELTSQIVNK